MIRSAIKYPGAIISAEVILKQEWLYTFGLWETMVIVIIAASEQISSDNKITDLKSGHMIIHAEVWYDWIRRV